MKIMCSRRDDVLRRKAEYEKEYGERKARHTAQVDAWESAKDDTLEAVENKVLAELSNVNLDINVVCTPRLRPDFIRNRNSRSTFLEIKVSSERGTRNNTALTWSYTVSLDENGNVQRETSSWSDLNATTSEQLDSLREILITLEILNGMDWATLLKTELPKYNDYVTESNPDSSMNKQDFDAELVMATAEDAVGTNTLLSGMPIRGGIRSMAGVWYKIVRETATMYEVIQLSDYVIQKLLDGENYQWDNVTLRSIAEFVDVKRNDTRKVKKDTFYNTMLSQPVETIQY